MWAASWPNYNYANTINLSSSRSTWILSVAFRTSWPWERLSCINLFSIEAASLPNFGCSLTSDHYQLVIYKLFLPSGIYMQHSTSSYSDWLPIFNFFTHCSFNTLYSFVKIFLSNFLFFEYIFDTLQMKSIFVIKRKINLFLTNRDVLPVCRDFLTRNNSYFIKCTN